MGNLTLGRSVLLPKGVSWWALVLKLELANESVLWHFHLSKNSSHPSPTCNSLGINFKAAIVTGTDCKF
eukprot:1414449-Amphidinium_carterae.2